MANNTDTTAAPAPADWRQWRAQREASLVAPHGPLSPVSMLWLDKLPRTTDGAPGRWSHTAGGVHLELDAAGNPHRGGRALNPDHRAGTVTLPAPDTTGYVIDDGDTRIEVARRGERVLVRPRHPGNAARLGYRRTPTFPLTADWVIEADFSAHLPPRPVTVGAVAPGLTHDFTAVGELSFTREGRRHTLLALAASADPADRQVQVIFTDATSGVSTWRDNRQVTAVLDAGPARATRARIDFNRALNFPGAYTNHATCPLPPAGNHLDLAVTAGEQIPDHRREQPAVERTDSTDRTERTSPRP